MKDRLVKGANLVGVVRLLRSHQHTHPLPEMGAWEQDLMRKRVAPSTWYALGVFDSLLQMAHRFVFDGSESAAQAMGRVFAKGLRDARAEGVLNEPENPLATLTQMSSRWRNFFNFGELSVTPWPTPDSDKGASVRLTGYPDMSACHGQVIIGWSLQLVEDASAKNVVVRIEERPWMHNSVLHYMLTWS